jgi:hypothetical protein
MPKTPAPTENKAAAKLKGFQTSTLSALNKFSTAAISAGDTIPGSPAAAELAQRVAEQVGKLFGELGTMATSVGGEVATDFDRIMNILDPVKLVETFGKLIDGMNEAAAKFWIALLQEIKKIIRTLWDIFFGKLPKWLETILLLIDELAKHAVGLMFPKLLPELNAGEVAYLQEIYGARRITLLESRGSSPNDA